MRHGHRALTVPSGRAAYHRANGHGGEHRSPAQYSLHPTRAGRGSRRHRDHHRPLGATACGFNANAISAPADAAFEVVLVVEDTVLPHNFSLYMDTEFQDLIAEGKFGIAADLGPGQVTTDVPALAAGIYDFRCDSHSRTMSGTVTTH